MLLFVQSIDTSLLFLLLFAHTNKKTDDTARYIDVYNSLAGRNKKYKYKKNRREATRTLRRVIQILASIDKGYTLPTTWSGEKKKELQVDEEEEEKEKLGVQ